MVVTGRRVVACWRTLLAGAGAKGNGLARSSASCRLFLPPLAERTTPEDERLLRMRCRTGKRHTPDANKQMVDNENDAVRMDRSLVPPEAEDITGTKQRFAPARYYAPAPASSAMRLARLMRCVIARSQGWFSGLARRSNLIRRAAKNRHPSVVRVSGSRT